MNLMNEPYLMEMNYVEKKYSSIAGSVRMNDFFEIESVTRFNDTFLNECFDEDFYLRESEGSEFFIIINFIRMV